MGSSSISVAFNIFQRKPSEYHAGMELRVYLLANFSIDRYLCYHKNTVVLFMQVDLCAEEMGNNVSPAVALLGDINGIVTQVVSVHIPISLIS